jgi:hypothetical protein
MITILINLKKSRNNTRYEKAGGACFKESEMLNTSFVHLMKFSAETLRLLKEAKRYRTA